MVRLNGFVAGLSKNAIVRLPVALMLVVVGALVTAGPLAANNPANDKPTAEFEQRYMEMAIDHHAGTLEMAKLCVDKATIKELRSICSTIVQDLPGEIRQLQQYLRDWYGNGNKNDDRDSTTNGSANTTDSASRANRQQPDTQPEITKRDKQRMAELRKLNGRDFDRMFMEEMIRDHWQIVAMSELCLDQAQHEELLKACDHTVREQSQQIVQFQKILKDQFGINFGQKPEQRDGGLPEPGEEQTNS